MKILGIETSCDETAAAIVADGRTVLADVVRSQVDLHREFGGTVPEIASRSHLEALLPVVREALERAGLSLDDIDAFAVTNRPGLIGALLVGVAAAKAFALALDRPLVGVDHLQAHVYAAWMDADAPPRTPFLSLVVSGGHTTLFRHDEPYRGCEIGRTLDDAAGEAFDKVAKVLGLGYPGGPEIERAARGGDPRRFRFKPPLVDRDGVDFSFSGLKTAVKYRVTGTNSRHDPVPLDERNVRDLAASFQEAVVEGLVDGAMRALERVGAEDLVVGGGCAANERLRTRLAEACSERSARLHLPPPGRATDNAAMIAGLGYHLLALRGADGLDLEPLASGEER